MKICPKCNNEHILTGVYCSRKCANSRNFSAESIEKKRNAAKKNWDILPASEKERRKQILLDIVPRYKPDYAQTILSSEWSILGIQGKRLRVILEQSGECGKCNTSHWNGERITLEYEHIDGNNQNNDRSNVIALCPNCHSQTKTWRGRKNGDRQKKISEYREALLP
jgi:hypothetical protein